ncbi:hypothetical protein M9435_005475 [Picochlorum sp. BPE23]|nr:hypothetical protein M9435_005475 [Picochlorum sp. BPE23]
MLFCSDGIPLELVLSWTKVGKDARHRACMDMLTRLRIVRRGEGSVYCMHEGFQRHVQRALGGARVSGGTCVEDLPNQDVVDAYAWDQWERVLLFAIGTGDETMEDGAAGLVGAGGLDLKAIMISSGLIAEKEKGFYCITQTGFRFLLSDTHTQVWGILQEYIKHAESFRSSDLFDMLIEFILQLGFQRDCMSMQEFSPEKKEISSDLCRLGLLYPFQKGQRRDDVYLVPTRLAVMLSSRSDASVREDGFVIVETNYRVYAYTSSPLKQSILRLFVRCDVLLPNLFVGTITRDSVMSALESGVTSEQIIGYLTEHAHKKTQSRIPIVPGVVTDQIRLWQKEIQRMETFAAVLYKNFETEALYKDIAVFTEKIGAMVFADDSKQEIVAVSSFHEQIREKIKLLKQNM